MFAASWVAMKSAALPEGLSWRRFAGVAMVAFVLSTQVLVQPALLELWSTPAIARGWLEHFAEVMASATAMWLLATTFAGLAGDDPVRQALLAIVGLVVGAFAGTMLALALFLPPGFHPSLPQLAGDALRMALFGALLWFAWRHLRRAAHQADAVEAAALAREDLERRLLETHLEVLRAQIEPHFLFNTLAHVRRLHAVRPETGARMLSNLRQYLAAALPRMREGGSTLGHEIEFARAYLDIIELRLGGRLVHSVDVEPELASVPLPSMMLITLVENAVKHGIAPCAGGGTIAIRARREEASLVVEVADTGMGFQASDGAGVGLANIRARLRGLHGGAAALELLHNEPRGVISRLRVPMGATA